jgi:G3E family GTPase
VTVVDGYNFLKDYQAAEDLKSKNLEISEDDHRTITDLLIDQVEFANVIILNKTDLISSDEQTQLMALLKKLNPEAKVILSHKSAVNPKEILNTNMFNFEKAASAAGWMKTLRGEEHSEVDEYGISSFVYRARRPFHPDRIWNLFQTAWEGVIRSKGFFWVASRPTQIGSWSQAGGISSVEGGGIWYAAQDQSEWDADDEELERIQKIWDADFGDRMQELVLIGQDMNQESLTKMFDECLLTDAELKKGKAFWSSYRDPFPEWLDSEEE